MLFLNNAFTKDITEYDGEVLKEVKTVDGKIYLSNGAIIKEGVVGKFFDIATNDKTVLYLRLTVPMRSVLSLDSLLLRAIPLLIISHSDYQNLTNCGRATRFAAFFFSVFMTLVGFTVFIN